MGKDVVYNYYIWLMDQKGRIRHPGGPTTEEKGKKIAARIDLTSLSLVVAQARMKLGGWEYTYERQAQARERKQGKGQQS